MTRSRSTNVADLIRGTDPDVLWRVATMCDGHSIIDPQALRQAGLPKAVVADYTTTHRSGRGHKSTLFVNGQPVKSLKGVNGLTLLTGIAIALGVEYRSCLGRGSQANAIQAALRKRLLPEAAPTT